MAMLLAVRRAARSGARIAPCSTLAKARGSPVVPLLQRVLPAASGFGYVPHDVVLNHCHCPIAANGHWARSVALNMALFGGRSPVEIMTVRQPLSRLLSMYYWFGGSKRFWAKVPGVQDGPLTSRSVRDATAFASAPQLYTKGGARLRRGFSTGGDSNRNNSNNNEGFFRPSPGGLGKANFQ